MGLVEADSPPCEDYREMLKHVLLFSHWFWWTKAQCQPAGHTIPCRFPERGCAFSVPRCPVTREAG